MSTRTTINLVEVLAMPSEQISKIKEKILAEIKDFEKKIEIRRAMLEYSDELEEDIGEDAPDEDETEYILPHSALPTSQLPPPEDGRFIKATQDEVTLAILNEFSPAPLHYEKIA